MKIRKCEILIGIVRILLKKISCVYKYVLNIPTIYCIIVTTLCKGRLYSFIIV